MRTTLDIDDDVLEAVKELAQREKKTAGAKLSELARLAILGPEQPFAPAGKDATGGFAEEEQVKISGADHWPTFPRDPNKPRRISTVAEYERLQDELDREDMERALSPRR